MKSIEELRLGQMRVSGFQNLFSQPNVGGIQMLHLITLILRKCLKNTLNTFNIYLRYQQFENEVRIKSA